jgi:hypothetical protein
MKIPQRRAASRTSSSLTSVVEQSAVEGHIPNNSEIEAQLKIIGKQSAISKAFYQAKLEKTTHDLKSSNEIVEVLQQELEEATAKRAENQKRVEEAKNKREMEAERLQVRKLRLEILSYCLETDFKGGIMGCINLSDEGHFLIESHQELTLIRKRLEDIHKLFLKAKKAEESKIYEMRKQAVLMKHDAASKYILFQKYNHI